MSEWDCRRWPDGMAAEEIEVGAFADAVEPEPVTFNNCPGDHTWGRCDRDDCDFVVLT